QAGDSWNSRGRMTRRRTTRTNHERADAESRRSPREPGATTDQHGELPDPARPGPDDARLGQDGPDHGELRPRHGRVLPLDAETLRLHRGAIRMGTALLILGIVGAVVAGLSHWFTLRRIRRGESPGLSQWPLSVAVAMLTAVIGLVGLWNLFAI